MSFFARSFSTNHHKLFQAGTFLPRAFVNENANCFRFSLPFLAKNH